MTPISPIALEKSLCSVELELIEINEDERSRCFVADIKLLLSAAKERLQQLKGGDMQMSPEDGTVPKYPLTSPEPVTAAGRGEVIETPRTDAESDFDPNEPACPKCHVSLFLLPGCEWNDVNPERNICHNCALEEIDRLQSSLITAEKERDEMLLLLTDGRLLLRTQWNILLPVIEETFTHKANLNTVKLERDEALVKRDSLKSQLSAAENARDYYAKEIYRLAEELQSRESQRSASNKDAISPNQ